jgi:Pretoxin HINT domain
MISLALLVVTLAAEAPPATTGDNPDVMKAYAAEKAAASRDANGQVTVALWCESHRLEPERIKHLALAVLSDPKHAAARGLMGLLPYQGKWETPDSVGAKIQADAKLSAKLAEYNARRDRLDALARGHGLEAIAELEKAGKFAQAQRERVIAVRGLAPEHIRLGLWCEQNGLKAEAAAHFTQAVVCDPYHEPTWKHLGYVKHDGRWMSHEQIAAEEKEILTQRRATTYWRSTLLRWREDLKAPSKREKTEAELATVTDPRAVPSIGVVFGDSGAAGQKIAVQLLGQIDSPRAARALAFLAVESPFDAVRDAASKSLQGREPRDWAEALVQQIHAPAKYEARPVGGPGSPGALMIETPRFKVLRSYDAPPAFNLGSSFRGYVGYDLNGLPVVAAGRELDHMVRDKPANRAADLANIEAKTQNLIAEANLKAVTSQRRMIADVTAIEEFNAYSVLANERITSIFRTALDAPSELKDNDEDGWNQWLYDKIGYRYEPTPQITYAVNAAPQSPAPRITSCFVAGTPVHTMTGRQPIETLRVGDQVLSQDVTTGALGFHPVLVVHHNPPGKTIKITLDNGDSVTASIYHRFYRAGRGWAMARELQTGDSLRSLGGLTRVVALEPGPKVPVYNLDVAASRTFFVGAKDALVHDNTLPDPRARMFDAAVDTKPR